MQQTNLTAIIFLLFFRWRSPLSSSPAHFYLYEGVYIHFLYFYFFYGYLVAYNYLIVVSFIYGDYIRKFIYIYLYIQMYGIQLGT